MEGNFHTRKYQINNKQNWTLTIVFRLYLIAQESFISKGLILLCWHSIIGRFGNAEKQKEWCRHSENKQFKGKQKIHNFDLYDEINKISLSYILKSSRYRTHNRKTEGNLSVASDLVGNCEKLSSERHSENIKLESILFYQLWQKTKWKEFV